ncbi:MAG TPA: GTP-binding protein [Patescibacteria group bacterium]|nr:GTP-binding protein [Patescibacteria group bacterium]
MKKQILKIVIVGHVDHGKSTLIGRLLYDSHSIPLGKKEEDLAFLTDQLREEREQAKTIDTTQVFFRTKKRDYVVIDAPGHGELIKNMLTGASLAQAGVLIVDAREGIEEQTRRHAYLLKMLGIEQLIVACNKMDLVGYEAGRFAQIKAELLGILEGMRLKPRCVVPISAKAGENILRRSSLMPWYKGPALMQALDTLAAVKRHVSALVLRFCCQDVYRMGQEDIVVGKVVAGRIKQGQRVSIAPSFRQARIRAIRIFPGRLKQACAGQSIGLVLDGASPVKRGEVLVDTKAPPLSTRSFQGEVFWLSDEPLALDTALVLRCATQETECAAVRIQDRSSSATLEVVEADARRLQANEIGTVTLQTKDPVVIEKFSYLEELGRFTLEKKGNTAGVGVVG